MSNPRRSSNQSPEERYRRRISAKRKFKAIVRLIIANLTWLQELEDQQLGDNVKRNIAVLTRKKGKKSILTLHDKAVLNKPQESRTEAEKAHLRRLIGNLKCFRRYPLEVKNELPAIMYFCYFGPNRVIVRQDYEPLNMYVILTGEVVVTQTTYDPVLKEHLTKDLTMMTAGDYFGEVSLLHGIKRTATVTTTESCEFLYIKRDDFDRVLKQTVANQWAEFQDDMSQFSYFDNWNTIDLREACIYAKKTSFSPDQIVLSCTKGYQDCVYFIVQGSCYLLECLEIETTMKNGKTSHSMIKGDEEDKPSGAKKSVFNREESVLMPVLHPELRPSISVNRPSLSPSFILPSVQTHFFKVCAFRRLGCFNVGEPFRNRIIVAETDCDCLLLPRYFLLEKNMLTFKNIAYFLTRHIPNTNEIFQNFKEELRWGHYKSSLVHNVISNSQIVTKNTVHNVPFTIRLAADLGEK